MQPDVLICVEHVARELDIACAVRYLAERDHGLRVHISSMTEIPRRERRPQVIVVPYFLSVDDFGLPPLVSAYPDTPFVNLAFEQVLFRANARFKRPRDRVAKQDVLHLASGEFFQQHLRDAGVDVANIRTTGSLSCSLYRPPYRDYFRVPRLELANRHQLDPDKPWVFFPENFGAAFFKDSQIRHRARRGFDEQALHIYRDFARRSFERIMRWCAAAVEQGTAELIIRPRPATPRAEFVKRFAEVTGARCADGLHFIKQGSVREWILASEVVVSSFSTSLLESAVAEKPSLLLAPEEVPDCLRSEWLDHATCVQNESQFAELIRDPLSAQRTDGLGKWAKDTLLNSGDPIRNVTQLVSDICSGQLRAPAPPRFPARVRTSRYISNAVKSVERKLRAAMRGEDPRNSRLHEDDHIHASDVDQRVARWAAVLDSASRTATA